MNVKDMFDLKRKSGHYYGRRKGNRAEDGRRAGRGRGEHHALLKKEQACQKAAGDLKLGVKTLAIPCDVKSTKEIQAVVDETIRTFGRLDILVNNSGANWGATPEDYPLEGWQKVMETNFNGLFLFSQIAGRAMIRQKGGSIINITSIMGVVGTEAEVADAIAYSASKGAVITFTKDLAAKWAKHNIRVNAIAPGWFPTDMSNGFWTTMGKSSSATFPWKIWRGG